MAEHQITSWQEPLVQIVDDAPSRSQIEIDENIAAKNSVYAANHAGARVVEQAS